MRKTLAALLLGSFLFSVAGCSMKSKYDLSKITLTESERSWSCPEDKYTDLISSYQGKSCFGTMVVATDDDVVYLYCENSYEKDGTTLLSQNTVFDIGSVSKTFTAVAILQLAEKGKLDINDSIDKYFPEYEKGSDITIYNLLHMTSGIPDYLNNPDPFWGISGADAANAKISDILMDRVTDEEFMEALYQAPLEFDPGTDFTYSNTNYRLLALIIEQVTGKDYCDYVKTNIFDKCGMDKTTSMATGDLTYTPIDYDDLVAYNFSDENGYPVCPKNTRGDGGIHSCLTDLLKFDRALFGGKLLKKSSMDIMLTGEFGYCCGLFEGADFYYHDGSSLTCSSDNKIINSEEFGHIYVIKLEHSPVYESYEGEGPLEGTIFIPGVFENGIYNNTCAGLTANIPENFTQVDEKEIIMINNSFIESISDERDVTREMAMATDQSFWDSVNWTSYDFNFLNTATGVPDDDDYTEDEFLDDEIRLYTELNVENEIVLSETSRELVTICGEEYLRSVIEVDDHGDIGYFYFYARKIDDDLLSFISISTWSDESIEELQSVFK